MTTRKELAVVAVRQGSCDLRLAPGALTASRNRFT